VWGWVTTPAGERHGEEARPLPGNII